MARNNQNVSYTPDAFDEPPEGPIGVHRNQHRLLRLLKTKSRLKATKINLLKAEMTTIINLKKINQIGKMLVTLRIIQQMILRRKLH